MQFGAVGDIYIAKKANRVKFWQLVIDNEMQFNEIIKIFENSIADYLLYIKCI